MDAKKVVWVVLLYVSTAKISIAATCVSGVTKLVETLHVVSIEKYFYCKSWSVAKIVSRSMYVCTYAYLDETDYYFMPPRLERPCGWVRADRDDFAARLAERPEFQLGKTIRRLQNRNPPR
jgi:hypothetical protein